MKFQGIARLRQWLGFEPSWEVWNRLVAELDQLQDSASQEDFQLLLAYVEEHLLQSWPVGWQLPNANWSKSSAGHSLLRPLCKPFSSLPAMKAVWCPPATFQVGAKKDDPFADEEERPRQWVTLTRPFWMQTTLVTQEQWEALAGYNPTLMTVAPDLPIDSVNWLDAVVFCNALSQVEGLEPAYTITPSTKELPLYPMQQEHYGYSEIQVEWNGWEAKGYRLPFEVEWEWAARAGAIDSTYSEDSEAKDIAWTNKNADEQIHPVAQLKPNAWGLYDMLGNLWEWCSDTTEEEPSPTSWPLEPMTDHAPFVREEEAALLRGGCWVQGEGTARFCARAADFKEVADEYAGFRICRTA